MRPRRLSLAYGRAHSFFGLLAVAAMLVFYALEAGSPWFILAFAGACAGICLWLPARRAAVRSG
jgi:hypothetical protein